MSAPAETPKRNARKIELVDPASITLDYALYPRPKESSEHIRDLMSAMEMEAALPPLIVWEKTGQLIDGFHRWHAHVRHFRGEGVPILVEFRDYPTQVDAFKDGLELNAAHGLRLRSVDRDWVLERAREIGMTPQQVAVAIKLPIARLTKRRTDTVSKGWASTGQGTTAKQREDWVQADQKHNEALAQALRDLSRFMEMEIGPGKIPDLLRRVNDAKKAGKGLRNALLEVATAFVWWVARTPADPKEPNGVA